MQVINIRSNINLLLNIFCNLNISFAEISERMQEIYYPIKLKYVISNLRNLDIQVCNFLNLEAQNNAFLMPAVVYQYFIYGNRSTYYTKEIEEYIQLI